VETTVDSHREHERTLVKDRGACDETIVVEVLEVHHASGSVEPEYAHVVPLLRHSGLRRGVPVATLTSERQLSMRLRGTAMGPADDRRLRAGERLLGVSLCEF
jgi:hypothetical protein